LGITFIYVTHDQDEALSMSDRLAVFRGGEIEQIGTPAAIYETPASRFVADFVGNANVLGQKLALKLTGVSQACAIRPEKIFFAPEPAPDDDDIITVQGRVLDVHYHGASTRFTVDVGAGQQVVLIQQNDEKILTAPSNPDQKCVIAWRKKDAHFFNP
jgi:putative spermidine/putrescine transport system ATP-binding protein